MNRVLRIGLWILGASVLSFLATPIIGGSWGPCGPSNIWALIFLLVALVGMPVGAVVSVIGFVIQRRRLAPQLSSEPR